MTRAPASLKKAQAYLHDVTDLPWVSLGIVGDDDHDGGYHCGEDRVDADDYSVDESSRDKNGLSDYASALDVGNFNRLREFSKWLVAECVKGAEDTKDIREVIYSPDGKTVKRWDRLGKRSSGDKSHLKHTHISYFRDSSGRDKNGLFRRFFENVPSKPSTPKPSKPTSKPAPTPHYSFPLPSGYYFGPKGGPKESVSGYYGRSFKGVKDRDWLKRWGVQMGKRGWNLKANLPSGNDGFFGPEYARFVKKFQADQGLRQDGKLGPATWRAAFENPVR
jgi:peptidoglycan hydrolase-like protein with peptidoglycan-binding domain